MQNMSWLINNPIANMKGPAFLMYYGGYCLALTFLHWQCIKLSTEANDKENKHRGILFSTIIGILVPGSYKLAVALYKGYYNVLFLIFMGIVFCFLQYIIQHERRST